MPSRTKVFAEMKDKVFAYCIFLCCARVLAQTDTLLLCEITVTDLKSKMSAGYFAQNKIDSTTRSNFNASTVAQMLLQQNSCFVRSYGPANIASISVRGSTAQQTAVVWNGVNINNPMLGQADVSLLPVGFFSSASLQKGALSGYWGSGAMAGVLNLNSGATTNGITVKGGSYWSTLQNFSQTAAADISSGKWSSSTKILADISQNRYSFYRNFDSLITAQQEHAQTTQYALMQDLGFRINAKQQIGLHVWLQDANRNVPYSLQELKQDAVQQDKIFRALADWKLTQSKFAMNARAAFINEALIYGNKTYLLRTDNVFKTILADVEGQCYLPKGFALTVGSSNSISMGTSQGYAEQGQLVRNALFENISWKNSRVNISVYGRQEIFNGKVFVPTGGLVSSVQILKWLTAKVNAGTIYRYPTLNDLYWSPGGDPDLKPEHGLSEEGSLQVNHNVRKFAFSSTGTIFNRKVSNWILWLPGKNGVWSPQNVLQVWSRGGESNSEFSFKTRDLNIMLNAITNYVLSSRTQTSLENDASKDRQLPYVPMYSGSSILSVTFKNTTLRSAYVYTGYRYLTSDNYSYLTPYHLFDLRLSQTFICKTILLNAFIEGNNLFNANYFSVAQYPMPLRNFKVGLTIQYHKNK